MTVSGSGPSGLTGDSSGKHLCATFCLWPELSVNWVISEYRRWCSRGMELILVTKGSSSVAKFNLNPRGLNLATSLILWYKNTYFFSVLLSGSWQVCKLCWVLMQCPHLHTCSFCQELQDENFLPAVAPGTLGTVTWESNNQLPSELVGNVKSRLRQIW